MTHLTESVDPTATHFGPWPINDQPFWRHGGKRFTLIMLWLAVVFILLMGQTQSSLPWVGRAMALAVIVVIFVPGAISLALWGLAQRTRDSAKARRLEAASWKALLALSFLAFALISGFLALLLVVGGWDTPPLPIAVAFGVIVAMGLFFGVAGVWVWLMWSKRFEIGDEWLLPTSYGIVRHRGRRVPFSDLKDCVLFLPEPSASEEGPPRFHWHFDAGALGRCDIDSGVLDEAHVPVESLSAIRDRVIQVNKAHGGKIEALTAGMEKDLAISDAMGRSGGEPKDGNEAGAVESEGSAPGRARPPQVR